MRSSHTSLGGDTSSGLLALSMRCNQSTPRQLKGLEQSFVQNDAEIATEGPCGPTALSDAVCRGLLDCVGDFDLKVVYADVWVLAYHLCSSSSLRLLHLSLVSFFNIVV
jgi:hypothetical protein